MFQAVMEHERPQLQSLGQTCQSTGQDVRLPFDLDTLGHDDCDLTDSALAGHRPDSVPGTTTKKTRRGSKHSGRDRITCDPASEDLAH